MSAVSRVYGVKLTFSAWRLRMEVAKTRGLDTILRLARASANSANANLSQMYWHMTEAIQ